MTRQDEKGQKAQKGGGASAKLLGSSQRADEDLCFNQSPCLSDTYTKGNGLVREQSQCCEAWEREAQNS